MNRYLKNSLKIFALFVLSAVAFADSTVGQLLDDGELQARVDFQTGEIILDLGPGIAIVTIDSGGAEIFDTSAFDAMTGLGPASQLDPDVIGFLSFGGLPFGTYSLGPVIAQQFRTLSGVEDLRVQYGVPGAPTVSLTTGNCPFPNQLCESIPESIPEPGSLILLTLVGVGVSARRRMVSTV